VLASSETCRLNCHYMYRLSNYDTPTLMAVVTACPHANRVNGWCKTSLPGLLRGHFQTISFSSDIRLLFPCSCGTSNKLFLEMSAAKILFVHNYLYCIIATCSCPCPYLASQPQARAPFALPAPWPYGAAPSSGCARARAGICNKLAGWVLLSLAAQATYINCCNM